MILNRSRKRLIGQRLIGATAFALLSASCTTTTTTTTSAPVTAPFGDPTRARPAIESPAPAAPAIVAATPAAQALPAGSEWAARALTDIIVKQRLLLLGEVHDNAQQHLLRYEALRRALAAGARPMLLMEQFDRDRQPELDRARLAARRDRRLADPAGFERLVDNVIDAGAPGRKGWDWSSYRGFIALALAYDLPLVGANLSRADASKIVAGGFDAAFNPGERATLGLDRPPSDALLRAQTAEVIAGHCNQIDAAQAGKMALAQIARDAVMAALLRNNANRPAVLIAGNGHVRRDIGVPQWLGEAAATAISVGLEEDAALPPGTALALTTEKTVGNVQTGRYDVVIATRAAERADPCEGFKPR